ncbi:YCII-related protein, partial [Thamnocephalis sphaerospora]
ATAPALGQFLVLAQDFKDEGALERRLSVREEHMRIAKQMKREGKLIFGGAMLDAQGTMNGSALVYEAPDEAQVRRWVAEDPYIVGRVWDQVEIKPFRLAPLEQ